MLLLLSTTILYNVLLEKNYYEKYLKSINLKLKNKKDKYKFLAHHDELTNLSNRSKFKKQLKHMQEVPLDTPHYLTLFFIDIDKMKRINDSYGHAIGDTVLHIDLRPGSW